MFRSRIFASISAACVALASMPSVLPAATYAWNPSTSSILVRTDRGGLFGRMGHRHDIRAQSFTGTIELDPAMLGATRVDVLISAPSLKVIDHDLSAEDMEKVQRDMESKVLAVAAFPEIHFLSLAAVEHGATDDGGWKLDLQGTLSLHGVSKPIAIPVTLALVEGGHVRLKGAAIVKQKDFGIDPISVGLGAVTVKNEVRIEFEMVADAVEADSAQADSAAAVPR